MIPRTHLDDASCFAAAEAAYENGRFAEALDLLLSIQATEIAGEENYLLLLGVCYARLRKQREATKTFEAALGKNPDCFEATTWMAALKKNRTEIQEAIKFARRAVELRPDDAISYGSLGSCYLYLRDAEAAIAAFSKAVELSPEVSEHRHNLGLALLMAHRHGEAIPHLRKAIALAPRNPQSYLALSSSYALYGMAGDALDCLSQGLSVNPNSAPLHSAAAAAFAMIKNDAAAERHHRRAMDLSGDGQGAFAAWLLNQGRFKESDAIYETMIRNGPDRALAYYGLMQSRKKPNAAMIPAMQSLLEDKTIGVSGEMRLHYALGKAHDQLHEYEKAIQHYDAANKLAYTIHNAGHRIDPSHFRDEHNQVLRCYERLKLERAGGLPSADVSPSVEPPTHGAPPRKGSGGPLSADDSLSVEPPTHETPPPKSSGGPLSAADSLTSKLPTHGDPSEKPIFIIGMIRSGTTLLDQVLSSHASVASAGELRYWTEESLRLAAKDGPADLKTLAKNYLAYSELLAGQAERITDKMPLNFAYAGIIHRALPSARFIHIRRNPIDTCLSIYTTYFGQGSLFAYHKPNIVAYYREYQRMMVYWRTEIPADRLLEIDYEELISAPEILIPKIIDFCGLPWDEACLHHDQNTAAINTPSRWQARQPMYKNSMARWRNYEPWLGEFGELTLRDPSS